MGGGVMRTAAKAAVLGGYRSAGSLGEAAASRRIPRPSVATVTAAAPDGEAGSSISHLSSEAARTAAPLASAIRRPSWEVEDWEFAGGKEEELFDALHPVPRLVFGPVPTLEEAKEATSDLKDALEKVYFSSNTAKGYVKSNQDLSSRESSEISSAVPKHVVQAFSLLQGSPEAQNVVASLASDKNVYDAILNNDKVIEFFKSHQSVALSPETSLDPEDAVAGNESGTEYFDSPRTPHEETSKTSGFAGWFHDIKQKVTEVVSSMSDLLKDFMGTSTQETGAKASTRTSTDGGSYTEATIGMSFLALAIGAILVILFKRGA